MAANTNPRKSYKTLYLDQNKRRIQAEAKLYHVKQRLNDINRAIAPYGQQLLEGYNMTYDMTQVGPRPIELNPHEFVSARAYLESIAPFTTAVDEETGFVRSDYFWKNRPIARTA